MFAAPEAGFVFLSAPKTGSTTLERSFSRHATVVIRNPPRIRHMNAALFDLRARELLASGGHPRTSYELICMIREPVDWAASWWRYRARPQLQGDAKYTGDLSFDDFIAKVVDGKTNLSGLDKFAQGSGRHPGVERMFRYDNIQGAADWMAAKLDIPTPKLAIANASPERDTTVSPGTRALIESHFARHLGLYQAAT